MLFYSHYGNVYECCTVHDDCINISAFTICGAIHFLYLYCLSTLFCFTCFLFFYFFFLPFEICYNIVYSVTFIFWLVSVFTIFYCLSFSSCFSWHSFKKLQLTKNREKRRKQMKSNPSHPNFSRVYIFLFILCLSFNPEIRFFFLLLLSTFRMTECRMGKMVHIKFQAWNQKKNRIKAKK